VKDQWDFYIGGVTVIRAADSPDIQQKNIEIVDAVRGMDISLVAGGRKWYNILVGWLLFSI